jgi:hypothetical protein
MKHTYKFSQNAINGLIVENRHLLGAYMSSIQAHLVARLEERDVDAEDLFFITCQDQSRFCEKPSQNHI